MAGSLDWWNPQAASPANRVRRSYTTIMTHEPSASPFVLWRTATPCNRFPLSDAQAKKKRSCRSKVLNTSQPKPLLPWLFGVESLEVFLLGWFAHAFQSPAPIQTTNLGLPAFNRESEVFPAAHAFQSPAPSGLFVFCSAHTDPFSWEQPRHDGEAATLLANRISILATTFAPFQLPMKKARKNLKNTSGI